MSNAMYSTPIYQDYPDIRAYALGYVIVLETDDDALLVKIYEHLTPEAPYHVLIQASLGEQGLMDVKKVLQQYLSQAKAGIHIVVAGSEAFLWQIQQTMASQGCLRDEYSLIVAGEAQRLVYCVHCGHQQLSAVSDFCHCESCGVHLLIRTHFSQRLGAYMGVCANAQQPMGVQ
ncbi:hypothetical protein A3K93_14320 (plasmid) [Acinetobacter sp. NCu2D-2]|uniref:dimethylamine monooxygenase subunit DmmA family protein n=1 Tax=Acinetobacter sp. NCu2D-2 TaxID=1608473 RepID=UPI0007CDA853|nr:dimethylamine monooxygenase subunit DmmA family protein [Acinetobacter sp. NCu2D-2]ANF83402.1 hypothetical protein A3K93_14320 [Acinetobacter sp. NCu2D-2]